MGELGTWLVRAREARGLTIEDAERDTRISRRYLQALESEQFEVIPAPVYARGFLRSYSQYLGLDPAEMLGLFPRDDDDPAPVIGSGRGQRTPTADTPISGRSASRPTWRQPGGRTVGSQPRDRDPGMPKRPDLRRSGARTPQPEPQAPASRESVARSPEPEYVDEEPVISAPPPQRRPAPPPPPRATESSYSPGNGEYVIGGAPAAPATTQAAPNREPTIGVDIGVPVPARRIKGDPAAQAKSMMMLIVAGVAIAGIIIIALVISRLGGDDSAGTGDDDDAAGSTQSASATPGTTPTSGSSGINVTPGVVPNVIGIQSEQARLALEEAGFVVNETPIRSSVARGEVTDQAPAAGVSQPEGSTVIIVVSQGPQ